MTLQQRRDQHDRQMAAIRALIKEGMAFMLDNARRTQKEMRQLQQEVREFAKGLRGGGNGQHKPPVDLQ